MILALLACGAPDPAAVDATLEATNDALAAGLVVAELLDHVDAEVPRHDGCGTCPCIERLGTEGFYTLLEDYDPAGCTPDSGLLPAVVAGHVWLDVIGGEVSTIRAEQATLAGLTFAPELDAAWERDGAGWSADAGCDLAVGAHEAILGITARADADGVLLEGSVEVPGGRVELVGVRIPRGGASGGCPVPTAGSAIVRAPGRLEVAFTGPQVEVGSGRRTVSADLCAHDRSFLAL